MMLIVYLDNLVYAQSQQQLETFSLHYIVLHFFSYKLLFCLYFFTNTVEPRYNEVLGTMKITLLYQVSHYIGVKKQRTIKSWDQQNYLVIRGFCYIRPLYNEVPLYLTCTTYRWEHLNYGCYEERLCVLCNSDSIYKFHCFMICSAYIYWS